MFPGSRNDKRGLGAAGPMGQQPSPSQTNSNVGGEEPGLASQSGNAAGTSSGKEDGNKPSGLTKSPYQLPSVSLPSAGGSLRGMGEKFSVNPATGTGSFSVPITTSPGRGNGPQLALSYDSGSGSGSFGLGWSLSTPSIRRKTDKGIPRYRDDIEEEEDVFLITDAEDLVPVLEWNGKTFGGRQVHTRCQDGRTFKVTAYRPRIEGPFQRIWKVTDTESGETHWEVKAPNNTTTIYGDCTASRIADPEDPLQRVFEWLPSRSYDERGDLTVFEYKAEDSENVDIHSVQEQHRTAKSRSAHRYLKSIKYGNTVSRVSPNFVAGTDWLFQVVFDFGEHDDDSPTVAGNRPWTCRADPFSSHRSGFEIRHYRLCRRVLMFHHFPDEPGIGSDCVVSALNISYQWVGRDKATGLAVSAVVKSIEQEAWRRRDAGGYDRKSLPPVELTYSMPKVSEIPRILNSESIANLPIGVDDTLYQLVDLEGQGLTGIVSKTNNGLVYIPNNGQGDFGAAETILRVPGSVFSAEAGAWIDLDGDGKVELVKFSGQGAPGFYGRDWDEPSGWQSLRSFESLPNIPWKDQNVKLIDVTGDGLTDVLVTDGELLRVYYGRGKSGFADGDIVTPPPAEAQGLPRLVFWDGAEALYTADMSGDGLTDIVRIRHAEVCYWPSLGYGRFGSKVTMRNPPMFDHAELFDQSLLKLADVDGSGPTDLVYLGGRMPMIYQNLSGNGWSDGVPIHSFPSVNTTSNVQIVDLLGKGTACLLWSSKLPSDSGSQIRYLDLMEEKPYQLVKVENNTGVEMRMSYTSSSLFYARDKKAGRHWLSHLPFPVHCVELSEMVDHVSGNIFTTRYAYHDGYFDGVEREFRGFGFVESWDTEHYSSLDAEQNKYTNIDKASHIPPVLTRTWFHNGQFRDSRYPASYYRHEYYRDLGLHPDLAEMDLSETVLPTSIRLPVREGYVPHILSFQEQQEAYRALKGSTLRSEVYSLDGSALEGIPVSVAESSHILEQRQPLGDYNKHAVFMIRPKESINILYDRKLFRVGDKKRLDPRIQHSLTLEADYFGNSIRDLAINYGRRYDDPNPLLTEGDREKQRRAYAMLTETSYTNMIDTETAFVLPVTAESMAYEVINVLSIEDQPKGRKNTCWVSFEAARRAAAELSQGEFDIPFENVNGPYPSETRPYRRMTKKSRAIFRRDDLNGPLPLGVIEPLMLPHKNHDLVFNDTQTQLYVSSGKLKASELESVFGSEGAYHRFPGEDGWWSNSGEAFFSPESDASPVEELRCAKENFFVLRRARTPWHTEAEPTETRFSYDRYNLLIQDVVDPYGNIASVGERDRDPSKPLLRQGHDYRLLTAFLRMDPNRNRVEVAFDILGHVVAGVTMGKPEEEKGDVLDVKVDLDDKDIKAYYNAPKLRSHILLGKATSRSIYDLNAYFRTKHLDRPQPNWSSTITRETHESELSAGAESRVFVNFSYTDGTGRPIQAKAQCESGPLVEPDALERKGPRYHEEEIIHNRWLASSWVIYNNKGNPVRSYEPFFSDTHRFQDKAIHGVSPIFVYDSLDRTVAVINPDHTWTKVVFTPWNTQNWDKTDTVSISNPAEDPDVGRFIRRFRKEEYLPTWYAQRSAGQLGAEEERAAKASAVNAGTPSVAFFDALGRNCVKFETLRSGAAHSSGKKDVTIRQESFVDITGLPYKVADTKGRTASCMIYSFGKAVIREVHMDNGEKWSLKDSGGVAMRTWNGRGEVFRPVLDRNRRIRELHVGTGDGREEYLVEKTVYGEERANSEEANARDRIVEAFDQTGVLRTPAYDFKGNLIKGTRQLAKSVSGIIDWRSEVDLEAATYDEVVFNNALNKVTRTVLPDGTETSYTYNDRMMPATVSTVLSVSDERQTVIKEITYDEKGQRVRVLQGNGVETRASYDRLSFKVRRIVAKRLGPSKSPRSRSGSRSSSGLNSASASDSEGSLGRQRRRRRRPRTERLQDLNYTYDASGNITHIKDDAMQTIFFRNQRVDPSQSFRYDSLYRLVEATGREHVGQMSAAKDGRTQPKNNMVSEASGDHANDSKALARYNEWYEYDTDGNILALHHETPSESWAWTRRYEYDEPSAVISSERNNRLTRTRVGARIEEYRYESPAGITGSMTSMPTIPSLQYDYSDRLVATSSQLGKSDDAAREMTHYRYDATGKRVRKVVERKTADGSVSRVKETIYIGGAFEVFKRYSGSGEATLEIHSLTIAESGRRLLLIDNRIIGSDTRSPATIYRYQLSNHQGSSTMEVDQDANILSYEEYTPYGMSSLRSTYHQTEAPKRYRFLGKEQDDSGLYHLGARYYAAWLGRFISADPEGAGDGLNLYQYAQSNPVMLTDPGGTAAGPVDGSNGWVEKALESRAGLVNKAEDALKLGRELWATKLRALNKVFGARAAQDFGRYLQNAYDLGHIQFEKYLPGAGGGVAGSSKLDIFFKEWGIAVEHKLISVNKIFTKAGEFRKGGEALFNKKVADILEQASTRALNIQRSGEDIVSVLGITIKGVEKEGAEAKAFVTKLLDALPSSVKQGIEIVHQADVPLAAAREELNVAAKVLGKGKEVILGAAKGARRVGGPIAVGAIVLATVLGASSDAQAATSGAGSEGGKKVQLTKGERLQKGLDSASAAADLGAMGIAYAAGKGAAITAGATVASAAIAGAATGAAVGSYVAEKLEKPLQEHLGEAAGAGVAAGTGVLAGAASGAVVGALIGSVVPGVGTAVGAAVGGLAGAAGAGAKILINKFW